MAKPYKILELYKIHDCEATTDWIKTNSIFGVDSDCKEGKKSLKIVSTDVDANVEYTFATAIDLSALTHLRFWIKGDDCTLKFRCIDSADNWDSWNIEMPQTSWIVNTEVIATPDENSGAAVDYTDIKRIRFSIAEDAKTIYFDYIVAYKDITSVSFAPQVHRKVYEVSKGYFKSTLDISDNFCIEIYDENNNLRFEGNIKDRKYGNVKEYFLKGFDKVIGSKVSGDYTTSTIEVIAKALIDQVSYLRYITGSITTVAGDHTIKITERPFIEQLRKLADLFDGIGVISPNGVVYLNDGSTQCSEPEFFEATYISNPTVGLTGTDIPFIDSIGTQEVIIVSSWQCHKNILRINDDWSHHNITQGTSEVREFYIGTNDVTQNHALEFREGVTEIIHIRTDSSNLEYKANGGAWTLIQVIVNDTIYHLNIRWQADNTWDLWVNGTLKVDNKVTVNNMTSGINRVILWGDATALKYLYIDAWGDPDNDPDYTVGDNINGFVSNGKYGLLANNPLLEQIGLPINRIVAYGKMNMDTGKRLKSIANNTASQKLHGVVGFSVRAPHINTQAELDAFATTTLSRKGLTNSPREIKPLKLYNLYNLNALFMGRTVAFKLDAKGYTLADYVVLDTYWRGERSVLELFLSSGLLHSSEQDVDDSTIDEHQQDETGEEIYETDLNTLDLQIREGAGATWLNWYLVMNAVADMAYGLFYVNNEVDDSRNITITWTFRRVDDSADTINILKYVSAIKTDGSESFSWIPDDGTADTLPACAAGRFQKKVWTILAADFDIGDTINVALYINEADRTIELHNISIKYYIKR